jgi:hypothetical protein
VHDGTPADTIVRMRRTLVVVVFVALVVAGTAWAIWPATKWPQSFCAPIVRVIGADANPISVSFTHAEPTLTTAQEGLLNKLMYDLTLAEGAAPTAQLQTELHRYVAELGVVLSTQIVTNAMSQFDELARTQLRACGVTSSGS